MVGTNSPTRKESTVATAVQRKTKIDPTQTFAEHILLKRQAATVTTRANGLKDRLKKWFLETPSDDVYENDNGSKFLDFSSTVSDGKDEFKGMELRRSTPIKFDEEVAEQILRRKGVYEEALTPVIDQEKIYRLQQEGKITDKDLDKMFVSGESWAFWPVKGEVL
jgi:hypothetical protein